MRFHLQAIVVLCFLLPVPVLAWGTEGHEVVAHLAAMNLTPKARATVASLLGGEAQASMAIAANWADEIRDDRPETSPWHYVDIEISGDLHYRPARDCPGGNCVVAQIARDEAILKSGAPTAARAEALKFLIHFAGDIRQPLHGGDNHDQGGNAVQVVMGRGRPMTLHHFWDTETVAALGRDPAVLARDIDRDFTPVQKTTLMAASSAAAWAEDSAAIAKAVVYPQAGRGGMIDGRALSDDASLARQQLAKAGYALAGLLNRIFQ
jgi:hypothetical protein